MSRARSFASIAGFLFAIEHAGPAGGKSGAEKSIADIAETVEPIGERKLQKRYQSIIKNAI